MLQPIGAIVSLYEEQKVSCIEMIKSFRIYNPDSSIVILCDGIVSETNDICKEYNCNALVFKDKLGYPASNDINVVIKYIHRLLSCSNLVHENFYINLESDCLVTSKLEIDDQCKSILISNVPPIWNYFFYGDNDRRNYILPKMQELYKKYNVYDEKFLYDIVVGGGGFIYNKKFFLKILFDWENFMDRSFEIKNIYDGFLPNLKDFLSTDPRWFFDYLLSLHIQFYLDKNDHGKSKNDPYVLGKSPLNKNIIHPYKKFYI